jgi:hypothetical protein
VNKFDHSLNSRLFSLLLGSNIVYCAIRLSFSSMRNDLGNVSPTIIYALFQGCFLFFGRSVLCFIPS